MFTPDWEFVVCSFLFQSLRHHSFLLLDWIRREMEAEAYRETRANEAEWMRRNVKMGWLVSEDAKYGSGKDFWEPSAF